MRSSIVKFSWKVFKRELFCWCFCLIVMFFFFKTKNFLVYLYLITELI